MPKWRYLVTGIVKGSAEVKLLQVPDEIAAEVFDALNTGKDSVGLNEDDRARSYQARSYFDVKAFAYLKVERVPADGAPIKTIG